MNRLSAYRLRLVCLFPFALLLLVAPLLAQDGTATAIAVTETAAANATAGTVEAGTPATPDATGTLGADTTTAVAITSTAAVAAGTGTAAVVNATNTALAATGTAAAATSTALAALPTPQLTATPPATATPIPTPTAGAGGVDNWLVLLLIGGLFLLAGLAIIGLLLTRRRRAPRPARGDAPVAVRPVTAPPPVGAETVTGVLMPVYLQLEGDAPQSFAINETPFAIGRDPANNLMIDETFPGWETVSREHALISRHERGYVVEDLGSQNGVRVNGRLTPKNLLRSGWQVSIGGVTFRFVDETQTN